MRPLGALTADEARGLRGMLFDLDDTLLTHGLLTCAAYDALWSLKDSGLRLLAVTGRPSGWGEVLARQWPIDAAVTENGAVAVARDGHGVTRFERCDAAERRARRVRLARLIEDVRAAVPDARLTDDIDARRSDVTWDIGERRALPPADIDRLLAAIGRAGARSFTSSVHVHATFDIDDKASGTLRYLALGLGEDPGAACAGAYAFCGDSGNDAACFSAFRLTFAVANVRRHLARIPVTPRFVADAEMGEGFAAIAGTIVALRR